jgi:YihY family inner membrane protein
MGNCSGGGDALSLLRLEAMTSSAGSPGKGPVSPSAPHLPTGPPSSPGHQDNQPGTIDLQETPLRPGTAAQRLLAEDQRQEIFQYLPETYSISHRLRHHGWLTLRYLMQTEVHTYAFSVAANSILSFFPFIVLLLTVVHRVFHSATMYEVVLQLVRDYLPSNKDFVIRNLQFLASVRGRGQILSFVMLLITSTGIFLPLEVALNSVWGFKKNRSYLMNLVVALGLTLACGCLAMLSIALTAQNLRLLGFIVGDQNFVFQGLGFLVMKAFAIVATIAIYFLIYWVLPNGKVPARAVLPAAIITGVLSEGAKYLYILVLPWLNFQEVYGPFSVSVTLIFWSFWSGLLLLGGAYLSAAEHSLRVQARHKNAAAD